MNCIDCKFFNGVDTCHRIHTEPVRVPMCGYCWNFKEKAEKKPTIKMVDWPALEVPKC